MAVHWQPKGYPRIVPYLIVNGVPALMEFMQKVFGAEVVELISNGDQVGHAEVRIGESMIMLGEAGPQWPAAAASLYLYVPDVDACYNSALAAGATSISKPVDQFYGDRGAGIKDASGNTWFLATHIEDVSYEEIQRRAATRAK